jgi:hypothetical protein
MLAQEFRKLVATARLYLDGEVDYLTMYYTCHEAAKVVRCLAGDARIKQTVFDYEAMAERSRNEWSPQSDSISEAEFREWLRNQLEMDG